MNVPTPEQEARAKWDLLLTDIESRQERLRQLKLWAPWKMAATMATAVVACSGAIVAVAYLIASIH